MAAAETEYLEAVCKEIYQPTSSEQRAAAEKALNEFAEKSDCFQRCIVLLDRDKYLLNYILTRPKLEAFVLSSLCQVSMTMSLTKVGWFDHGSDGEYVFRNSVVQLTNLGQDSAELCRLAVQILSRMVVEMNQQEGFVSNAKFRYTAVSFRDDYLFEIFQLSLRLLRSVSQSIESLSFLDESQVLADGCHFMQTLIKLLLNLCESCLSYDFLGSVVDETSDDNFSIQGLSEPSAYHEFCRLVARIKSNYQLIELLKVEAYPKFLQLITEFTVTSLQLYQFSSNSIHYLLSFWQRMVSSMPYVRSSEPHKLKECAPLVTKAYIESRLNLPAAIIGSGYEDPLDDQGVLQAQMEQLSVIGRCEYENTCQILAQFFDQVTESYQRIMSQSNQMEISIAESKLAWLTYCFGSAIGGHIAFSSSDDLESVDGDLICRIFGLIRLTDSHLPSHVSKKLEHSYLAFLEQFRKVYFSDQCSKISSVYKKLEKTLGLSDEKMVLAVLMEKIGDDLNYMKDKLVTFLSFREVRITNIKFLCFDERLIDESLVLLTELSMGYTTGEHFPFLGRNSDLTTMKSRTKFYTVLVRLLTIDMMEDVDRLLQFFAPFTTAFNELGKLFTLSDSALSSQVEAKRIVIGLARDIRGVAFACNTKSAFVTLFDWIYPSYLSMLVRSIEAYPKLSQNYFSLLESLSFDHITFLGNLEPEIFIYLLQTLQEGLSSLDNIVHYLYRRFCRIGKARVVHAGVPPENDNCMHVLQVNSEILRQLLSTILNIIIFDECRCQWAMTRPLLGLIFLQESYFNQCKMQMIRNFPADKQAALMHSFDGLMDGIERNLTVKNFDRLSQNMAFFKREISECLKGIVSDPLTFTVNGISVFDVMV
ncbi:unnamed protein product [Soboliphyme baturini]|uniref:Importin N-terminal domain-containing protein n=1 Tax=Soboliphyme baturini TaxID=241478 RepID=A0A183IBI1_9BILA|nr:unnamed protein product [Soboliphyme baturini]